MPLKFVERIQDPIHGNIGITKVERDILSLDILTRLQYVKQMGFVYLAYPGANHTRYEHSIGVMHVAYMIGKSLGLSDDNLQILRLIALLHDVGHPPFSHCVEAAFHKLGIDYDHEQIARKKILSDNDLKDFIDNKLAVNVKVRDIADVLTKSYGELSTPLNTFKSIISSTIDADKIDYIFRDNYYCGFKVPISLPYYIDIFKKTQKGHTEVLGLGEHGKYFLQQLLLARYQLESVIHNHKINRIANYILTLSLEEAINNYKKDKHCNDEEIIDTISNMRDYEFLNFLKKYSHNIYPKLHDFIRSRGSIIEYDNFHFDFNDINPITRLCIYFLASKDRMKNVGKLTEELREKIIETPKLKEGIFLDIYFTKPPEIPQFKIGVRNYSDLPSIIGLFREYIEDMHITFYLYSNLQKNIYSKFDPNTNKKIRNYAKITYLGDIEYEKKIIKSVNRAIQQLIFEYLLQKKKDKCHPLDIILIFLNELHEVSCTKLNKPVYIYSLTELTKHIINIYNNISTISKNEKYNINIEGRSINLTQKYLMDLEALVAFKIIYEIRKAQVYYDKFTIRRLIRISGWGRKYVNIYIKNASDRIKNIKKEINEYVTNKLDYLNKKIIKKGSIEKTFLKNLPEDKIKIEI